MASKALISSASAMAPNRPKSGPISVGLGPRFVFFSSSSSASKRASSRRSLVVRSQDNNAGKEPNTPPSQATTTNADYGRWKSIEDKNYELKYEMPGKMASEKVDMKVEENMLVIKDTIELPPYCSKRDIKANLNDGSLIVTVPKIPKYEPTTIPIPVFSVPINKKPADDDPSSSDNNKPADDPSSSVNNKPADDSSTNKPADQM